jgi:hypothetical protein
MKFLHLHSIKPFDIFTWLDLHEWYGPFHSFTWPSSPTLALFAFHNYLGPPAQIPLLALHCLDGPSCPDPLACPFTLAYDPSQWSSALIFTILPYETMSCPILNMPLFYHHLIKSSSLV